MNEYIMAVVSDENAARHIAKAIKQLEWDDLLGISIRLDVKSEYSEPATYSVIAKREESHDFYAMKRQLVRYLDEGLADISLYKKD